MKRRVHKKVLKHFCKLEHRYDKSCYILDSFDHDNVPQWAIKNMILARNKLRHLYDYWKCYPHPSWEHKK